MRIICGFLLLISLSNNCYSQIDSLKFTGIEPPYSECLELVYNKETKTQNISYNFSNKWDIDGDKKKDSLLFVGNGGAHVFYSLKIILSSNSKEYNFPYIMLDMPYPDNLESLLTSGKNPAIQLVVWDFDGDDKEELFLNFNNEFGTIPLKWKIKGVSSKYVLLDYENQKFTPKDYFE